ncbi:MAG: PEP-utilizing enzyme [Patescibacteria group bacterium]|nr:PEP-utilizing enzyme [Patescibacteria group bacterium]
MESDNVLSFIKSQKWVLRYRADTTLLFYSARQDGVRRFVKNMQGIDAYETVFVPIKDQPVRAMNLAQTNAFHEASREMVLKNPQILADRIKENNELWVRIAGECEALGRAVKTGDETQAIAAFKQVADSYALNGAQFIVIFSLGIGLTEAGVGPEYKSILDVHDAWRNTVVLKEELLGKAWYEFLTFMASHRKIESPAPELMRHLSLHEFLDWLNGAMIDVDAKVNARKENGFIYLDLHDDRRMVDDKNLIDAVVAYFSALEEKDAASSSVKGQVAFVGDGSVTGKVIVVKNKDELSAKGQSMAGNILVTIQTTPHFIPYLKDVKAIVTDEGGITCHAAIVSREFKIPCVIGTKNGTNVLRDGDEVEVDVEKGIVKVLKRA